MGGGDDEGVLTYETQNAPRLHRIGCRRWQGMEEYTLEPKHVVDEDQIEKTFDHESHEHLETIKSYNAKIMNVSDIIDRGRKADVKAGKIKIVSDGGASPAVHQRQYPPVPMVGALPPPSPTAAIPLQYAALHSPSADVGRSIESELGSVCANFDADVLRQHDQHQAGSVSPRGGVSPQASVPGSFSTAAFKRAMSFDAAGGATPMSDVASSYGGEEEKCPTHLKGRDKWGWKMRQLTFSSALSGHKKYGRERRTANAYATDADAAGETKMGDALRVKCNRHQECEHLASGVLRPRTSRRCKKKLKG